MCNVTHLIGSEPLPFQIFHCSLGFIGVMKVGDYGGGQNSPPATLVSGTGARPGTQSPCFGRCFFGRPGDSVFVVDGDGFQILRFKDLTAVVAADVIDSVPSGQDFRFIVSAGAFHTRTNLF